MQALIAASQHQIEQAVGAAVARPRGPARPALSAAGCLRCRERQALDPTVLSDPVSESIRATQPIQRVHAILVVSAISAVLETEGASKPATIIKRHDSNEPDAEQLPRSLRPICRTRWPTEVAEQLPLTELRDAWHGRDADVQWRLSSAKPDAKLPAALRSAIVGLPGSELVPDANGAAIRGVARPV